ncbi:hypothetical protein E2C01_057029 [Portunus trituberculatus]|uniref:Uncharacterized protein n=1 Tax=Portunus trituberculatus TaxID=210409 RepID=A0A5B7H180_PORTR|nr:hypothetical protein [Portunus trituberculatus]
MPRSFLSHLTLSHNLLFLPLPAPRIVPYPPTSPYPTPFSFLPPLPHLVARLAPPAPTSPQIHTII